MARNDEFGREKSPNENTVPLSESRKRQEEDLTLKRRVDTAAYELFADYFAGNDRFEYYRTRIRQAKITTGYHLYMSQLVMYFILLALSSFIITSAVTIGAFFAGVDFTVILPNIQGIALVSTVFFSLLLLSLIVVAVLPTLALYLYPWYKADNRKREIETNLPYAIIFMYALSRGGTTILDMMRTIAESEDTYGEVSNEFKAIVREIEYFDTDIREAIERAGNETPSSTFSQFCEDLVGIVDSGGNTEKFLKDKSDEYLEQKEHDQENFLELLSLFGEIYVTGFVAGPLFIIVITTVMALVSGGQLGTLYMMVYLILPLGNILFAFFIDILNSGDEVDSDLESERYTPFTVDEAERVYAETTGKDSRIESLITTKKKRKYLDFIKNPLPYIREKPQFTFLFTLPAAIAYLIFAVGLAPVEPTPTSMTSKPVLTTTFFIVVPYLILTIPFSIFFEIRQRRYGKLKKQLPTMLKKILSANETGMSLVDSFELASGSMSSTLGEELKHTQNEIRWRGDIEEGLVRFAKKIDEPRLSRTIKLLTKANEYTGNLTEVLSVATRDIVDTTRLDRDRKNQMRIYTGIIILAFLVYLFVIVMLNQSFLQEIAKISDQFQGGGSNRLSGQSGFNIASFKITTYNMLFFHSALVQAVGSGLIAGQMGSENVLSGIKWGIILVSISTGVFVFVL